MSRPHPFAPLALGAVAFSLVACAKPADDVQAAPPVTAQAAAPATAQAAPAEPAAPASVKRIDIAVEDAGFSPSNIEVKKGEQVVLRFTRTTKSECLKAIAIPDLKITRDLPMNTPVEVAITPETEGKMVLQCWMAMVKATIQVVGS